jgi:hypothetical protein
VDPSDDGSNLSIAGGDGQHDGSDGNSVENVSFRDSGTPARDPIPITGQTPLKKHQLGTFLNDLGKLIVSEACKHTVHTDGLVQEAHSINRERFTAIEGKLDTLLEKMNTARMENTALRKAYHASCKETMLLKAAVKILTTQLNNTIAIPTPPSPDMEAIHSSEMESIMKELSIVCHELQDALGYNPPSKRKCAPTTVQ